MRCVYIVLLAACLGCASIHERRERAHRAQVRAQLHQEIDKRLTVTQFPPPMNTPEDATPELQKTFREGYVAGVSNAIINKMYNPVFSVECKTEEDRHFVGGLKSGIWDVFLRIREIEQGIERRMREQEDSNNDLQLTK